MARFQRIPLWFSTSICSTSDSVPLVEPQERPATGLTTRWPSSLTALQHRNFRLIWFGLLVSFSGTFMQNAALLWHVSLLVTPDKKALVLGLVGLGRVAPVVVFSMISGVVADAVDRRLVLLLTHTLAALVAFGLSVLAYHGVSHLWPVYVLAAIGGGVSAFDLPARAALVPMLVPREHLANAITLNTIMFQTASVVGPAAAGIVIAKTGIGMTYALNGISFF